MSPWNKLEENIALVVDMVEKFKRKVGEFGYYHMD